MATNNNYVSSTKFADISDECLWHTLEHLNFEESFGVMRVCMKWQKVTTALIEEEDFLELFLEDNETSQINFKIRDYNEKNVKRNLNAIFGNQAEIFFNYKLENIENVIINRDTDTTYSQNQPLTLMDIGWLFKSLPQMRALDLTNISIYLHSALSITPDHPLRVLSSRLTCLSLDSFPEEMWLSAFLTKTNVLEELCLKKGTYKGSQKPPKLTLLKRVQLDASDIGYVNKLVGNSPNLTDIRIKKLILPQDGMEFNTLLYFARFTQLKILKLGFIFKSLYIHDFSSDNLLINDNEALHFPNLQHFRLSGVTIGHSMFEKILSRMPEIRSLKLRNVFVRCMCQNETDIDGFRNVFANMRGLNKSCRDCPRLFIEKIASLKQLQELHLNNNMGSISLLDDNVHLNNRNLHGCYSIFADTLARLIGDERLPRLRRLRCTLADYFSSTLYEAFVNMAWQFPKKSFVMFAAFNKQSKKDEILAFKPRNLGAIHSQCTFKTDVLTPRRRMVLR